MNAPAPDMIVYDTEIVRCIPDRNKPRDPTLEYCEGWKDFVGMGISVLCAIDLRDRIPRVFMKDNFDQFSEWARGRIVAGFNNHDFDDPLARAHGIEIEHSFDLLRAVRLACGEPGVYTRGVTKAGRSVNAMARVNLGGMQKSEDGAQAPVLWQRGQVGRVVDYCLRDVSIEARLIWKLPTLIDPLTGDELAVEYPH